MDVFDLEVKLCKGKISPTNTFRLHMMLHLLAENSKFRYLSIDQYTGTVAFWQSRPKIARAYVYGSGKEFIRAIWSNKGKCSIMPIRIKLDKMVLIRRRSGVNLELVDLTKEINKLNKEN